MAEDMMKWVAITALVFSLGACAPQEQRPFQMATFCLTEGENESALRSYLAGLSAKYALKTSDASAKTSSELKAIENIAPGIQFNTDVINIFLTGKDGFTMSAANAGLPKHQVVVGFLSGKDRDLADKIAAEAISDLRQNWELTIVPSAQTAKPMSC